ncbi:helix-turn-helix transcriptional regulator [Salipiger sp. PrR007]|uniref:helix-turn-helix domain-containing protein n=1 Tax=Salipiger sp. PrR007 TaxID=2706884 RepID=UPI0013B67272|nr:helix-turn-helix transcriptional regulator [Salipiger sp. PrR007]NDW33809.1 helix-turn-helix transcriptional regulator [Salipiger sp. PrR007]
MRSAIRLSTIEHHDVRLTVLEHQGDSRDAVAARISRIRELSGLNKKDFASRLDMSPQAWGDYENGKRDLPLSIAKKLRSVYSIPLDFTYFGIRSDLPHRIATEL